MSGDELKKSMNIMFLIFSFNVGGIEWLLIDMANGMSERGNNITLCVINEDYDSELLRQLSPKVEVLRLGRQMGEKSHLKYMLRLAKSIRTHKIDVLHCQGINCVIFSLLAKLMNPRIKVINTVHDVGNYPSYSKAKLFFQNLILDRAVAISGAVEEQILARTKDKSKVVKIYNAIDLSRFHIRNKAVNRQSIIIGNVARFYPEKKGQDVLVDAVLKLKQTHKDFAGIECRFAGAVFKGQQSVYDKLLGYIDSNDLSDNIHFYGNVNDVPSFLNGIDIFVLPSRYEGFGISLIEALASGIPVIASNLDGPREIFELAASDNVKIGYLVEKDDSDELADKLMKCVTDIDSFDHQKMRDFVERHFSITEMIDEHLRLYRELL